MIQDQIDRLFSIDFFQASFELSQMNIEINLDNWPLNIDNDEAFFAYEAKNSQFKKELELLALQYLSHVETQEHLDNIFELFRIIENSLLKNTDKIIDYIIELIDKYFNAVGSLKTDTALGLYMEAWGYRAGVIDKIHETFIGVRDKHFESIKKIIYNEFNPNELITSLRDIKEFEIDYKISKKSDLYRIKKHLRNQINTLRDQKEFMIKTFVERDKKVDYVCTFNDKQAKHIWEQLKASEKPYIKADYQDFKTALTCKILPLKGFNKVIWNDRAPKDKDTVNNQTLIELILCIIPEFNEKQNASNFYDFIIDRFKDANGIEFKRNNLRQALKAWNDKKPSQKPTRNIDIVNIVQSAQNL